MGLYLYVEAKNSNIEKYELIKKIKGPSNPSRASYMRNIHGVSAAP